MELLGLSISDVALDEAAERILTAAASGKREVIAFVNAHCVNVAFRDVAYRNALQDASALYADGSGMAVAARCAGTRLRDNVNGTDLLPLVCDGAARRGIPLALLGARPGVAQACADALRDENPALEIAFVADGYFSRADEDDVIDRLNRSGARIVFVAMGVPRQELLVDRWASGLTAPVLLSVGGLFDFFSGAIPRAPPWLRRAGLEWTYRLWQEPRRLFARYVLGNPAFLARVLALRLAGVEALRRGSFRRAPSD